MSFQLININVWKLGFQTSKLFFESRPSIIFNGLLTTTSLVYFFELVSSLPLSVEKNRKSKLCGQHLKRRRMNRNPLCELWEVINVVHGRRFPLYGFNSVFTRLIVCPTYNNKTGSSISRCHDECKPPCPLRFVKTITLFSSNA